MASNMKVKDFLNEQRFLLASGSGTDADPYIIHHIVRLQDGTGSAIASGASQPGATERGLVVRNIPSGSQGVNLSDYNGASLGASNAVHVRPGANEIFTISGTVSASQLGHWHARLFDAAGLSLVALATDPANTLNGLIVRNIPSGSQAVTGSVGISGVVDVRQATASALNATVAGAVEVRQSLASALRATAEVYQASASALRATAEVHQSTASALNATVVGAVEARQSNASALQVTAEVRQAAASALQATVTQAAAPSGWTTRLVTPSGDTAMDSANSAVRVNLIAGGAGNGNLQDGVQSNLAATVVGYAAASPLTVRLTDTDGNYVAAGAGTQYTEDAAAAANPVGGQLMGRRRDALTSEVSDDGDVIALNATSVGELYVRHLAAIPVTDNGGTLTVDGTVSVSANNLNVRLQDGAGVLLQSGASDPLNTDRALIVRNIPSGSQAVTGSVGVTGVVDVRQATASALNATVAGAVEVRQSNASALRGTMEIYQAAASALNAQVVGTIAHGTADAGNPLKLGGKGYGASPANVDADDRVDAYFDRAGRLFVRSGHQAQDSWTATCAPLDGNIRATAVRTAGAAGVRQVVTGFTATLAGGSGAPTAGSFLVSILDGPSGTNYLWRGWMAIPATAGAMAGIARSDLWIKSSQASAVAIEFNAAGGANVVQSVSMEGTTLAE